MPTKRIRDSERQRCAQACESCRLRKQRCDVLRPCRRCVRRGLGRKCQVSNARYPLLASSLPSPDPHHFQTGITLPTTDISGLDPERMTSHSSRNTLVPPSEVSPSSGRTSTTTASSQLLARGFPAQVPQMSRLIKDTMGQYMFIEDSATFSFLQNIRQIVCKSLGSCPFVDNPLKQPIAQLSQDARREWIVSSAQNPPPKQSPEVVQYLQRWYMQSANCVLLLFRQDELNFAIDAWQENDNNNNIDRESPVYYLVLAIGAQTGPEDKDELAETLFNYARYLTVDSLMEDPNIPTIQAFALIIIYLLGASQRNSACMYLGMAVRAAYTLGLHRKDVSALFPPAEYDMRERLWKAIRILDLFISASLGGPPSTSETRDTASSEDYSACNDLSIIFESILSQIYAKKISSFEAIERISQHYRRWSAQSHNGFEVDGIIPGELLKLSDGSKQPNMGLLNLKQTAFWTIILLSFPFLLKDISAYVDAHPNSALPSQSIRTIPSSSNQVLVYVCLEAAIHNVDMLQAIFQAEHIPKRLPFVINSAFVSGLVLGIAAFGDFDAIFPIERSLRLALNTLTHFTANDAVAKRYLVILELLQGACDKYMETRAQWKMEQQSHFVGGLFGSIRSIGVPQHEQNSDPNMPQNEADITRSPNAMRHPSVPVIQTAVLEEASGIAQQQEMPPEFSDLIPAIPPNFLCLDTFGETISLYPIADTGKVDVNARDLDTVIRAPVNENEFIP
ncbi:hypothetical protein BGZ63DRAFT_357556 [Mariannaea sp. PMI_226]|nr:hypothetical protein BGZ63DRAFT_357556 [Mariannaea sp. PMI_226]